MSSEVAHPPLIQADWNFWPDGLDATAIWAACADLGVGGVELGVYRPDDELSADRRTTLEHLVRRHDLGVAAVLFSMPSERWLEGALASAEHADDAVDDIVETARRAAGLGAAILGVWPGADEPDGPDAWGRTAASLHTVAEAAARLGLVVAVEPKIGQVVATTLDAVRLCEEVGHPALGVLLDTGHALAAGESLVDLPAVVGSHLLHVHLGDSGGDVEDDLPPGSHHHFGPFLAALAALGYGGALSFDLYGCVASHRLTGIDAAFQGLTHVRAALDAMDAVAGQ